MNHLLVEETIIANSPCKGVLILVYANREERRSWSHIHDMTLRAHLGLQYIGGTITTDPELSKLLMDNFTSYHAAR
jgi:hypothetical protein